MARSKVDRNIVRWREEMLPNYLWQSHRRFVLFVLWYLFSFHFSTMAVGQAQSWEGSNGNSIPEYRIHPKKFLGTFSNFTHRRLNIVRKGVYIWSDDTITTMQSVPPIQGGFSQLAPSKYHSEQPSTLPGYIYKKSITTTPEDTFWSSQFGYAGLIGIVYAIAIAPNGDVYVGGVLYTAGNRVVNNIARWDGTNWSGLENGTNGEVLALTFSPNGDLYAGGDFTTVNGITTNGIAKWDGETWSSVGGGISGGAHSGVLALTFDSTGNLYAGGEFATAGGITANNIAKWDGAQWSALGDGVNYDVFSLTTGIHGEIYAGGTFDSAGGLRVLSIAKWDGSQWSAVGGGWGSSVLALATDIYGNIYAGGMASAQVAKWDGVTWSGVGNLTYGGVFSLAVSKDSVPTVYAGGTGFEPYTSFIARWDGASWSPAGNWTSGWVYAIAVGSSHTSNVYAGSEAPSGGSTRNAIMELNGDTWSILVGTNIDNNGLDNEVYSAVFDAKGKLYAAGFFQNAGGSGPNYLAAWDGTHWSPLNGSPSDIVGVLAADQSGDIYAGGYFHSVGGVSARYIAKWDGTEWSPLGCGINGYVQSFALGHNGDLYTGGYFDTAGCIFASNIARWNGYNWSSVGTGVNGYVWGLAVGQNGDIYAGGNFTVAGGVPVNNIAKWDGINWVALGSGVSGDVYALAVSRSGDLYAGGDFRTAGGSDANYIAKWDGTNWSSLGAGVNNQVYALSFDRNGDLYVGGWFDSVGGISANHIAKWDGNQWYPLGSGTDRSIWTVASNPTLTGDLFVGGRFSWAGGKLSTNIAHWNHSFYEVNTNWNLVSIPSKVPDYRKADVYPSAIGDAFAYNGGYVTADTLTNGIGYWLRFNSPSDIKISGVSLASDTVKVSEGWNLIGSIGVPILTTSIDSYKPGMIASRFFGYNNGYYETDTIQPGKGYWVKVNREDSLILSSLQSISVSNRIRIIATSETPPSPPAYSNHQQATPKNFFLEQNFPNPFNPMTMIRYELPTESHVVLTVSNILGSQVDVLVNRSESAGYKSVVWDARRFASGLYFCELRANSISDPNYHFLQTKKLLLLK